MATLEERRQATRKNYYGAKLYHCPICSVHTNAYYSEETMARHLDIFHRRVDIHDLVELSVLTTLERVIQS